MDRELLLAAAEMIDGLLPNPEDGKCAFCLAPCARPGEEHTEACEGKLLMDRLRAAAERCAE